MKTLIADLWEEYEQALKKNNYRGDYFAIKLAFFSAASLIVGRLIEHYQSDEQSDDLLRDIVLESKAFTVQLRLSKKKLDALKN